MRHQRERQTDRERGGEGGLSGPMGEFHLVNLLHSSGAVDELLEFVFVDQMIGNDE